MTLVDWSFGAVLLLSLLIGAWRGLVYEVLSIFVWIAAFILAQWFAPSLAPQLPLTDALAGMRYVLAFVLIFVGSAFVAGLLARLVKKLVASVGLRPVDRTLGAVFGLLRGLVLLLAVTMVVNMTPLRSQADWQSSPSVGTFSDVLARLKPVLPQEFGKYVP